MLCPIDQSPLTMTERQGIEIDFCPTCRGVWLDRGELDKIIERASSGAPQVQPAALAGQPHFQQAYPTQQHGYHKPHHKRRKSFLEELFD